MTREKYTCIREDLNECFWMYCEIKNLNPSREELRIIQHFVDVNKLRQFLNKHFNVFVLRNQEGEVLKVW